MADRAQLDEILHRVRNLLGTIEVQAEVVRDAGTVEAHAEALRLIVESARRTRADLQRLQGPADGGASALEA